jgi:pimeloyl-ACP methyl ester carboxylesterase
VSINVYTCRDGRAHSPLSTARPPLSDRRQLLRGVAAAAMAIGGGIAMSGCASRLPAEAPSLPAAVGGERRQTDARAGPLSYYAAGEGPPLLLIHSINAAASAYEVRPIFDDLRQDHRVFAPDLPGFGFSDRADRRYDPALYTAAVFDMLDVIALDQGQAAPVDALAISLSSEFLARAASQKPAAFRRLVLVTPTGFDRRSSRLRGAPGETRELPWLYSLFERPPWRQGLFDLLVSRRSIGYFLKRTFGSDAVPDELVDYSWRSAHQPGARHAPYAFVSAGLFSADIRDVYEKLTMPIWVPHGTRGDFRDFSGKSWVEDRRNWRFEAFPTGALPHFEVPDAFNAALRGFLAA